MERTAILRNGIGPVDTVCIISKAGVGVGWAGVCRQLCCHTNLRAFLLILTIPITAIPQPQAVADPSMAVELYAPTPGGAFEPVVHEMLGAVLTVSLVRRADQVVLFEGTGHHGGLEVESLEPGGMRLLTR